MSESSSEMSRLIRSRAGYEPAPAEPEPEEEQPTDFDGGARARSTAPVGMNQMIRQAAGY